MRTVCEYRNLSMSKEEQDFITNKLKELAKTPDFPTSYQKYRKIYDTFRQEYKSIHCH